MFDGTGANMGTTDERFLLFLLLEFYLYLRGVKNIDREINKVDRF